MGNTDKTILMEKLEGKLAEALEVLHEIYPSYNNHDVHNIETPHRVAKMWIEMFRGLDEPDFNFKKFPNEEATYDTIPNENWVILKNIEFSSVCQHHLLPFSGIVSIAYVPRDEICGISKLARVVEYFSLRPQVQERMSSEIYTYLYDELKPKRLVVITEAKHDCVACRGIKSRNSSLITTLSLYPEDVRDVRELIK